jgi:hypothetical protein
VRDAAEELLRADPAAAQALVQRWYPGAADFLGA